MGVSRLDQLSARERYRRLWADSGGNIRTLISLGKLSTLAVYLRDRAWTSLSLIDRMALIFRLARLEHDDLLLEKDVRAVKTIFNHLGWGWLRPWYDRLVRQLTTGREFPEPVVVVQPPPVVESLPPLPTPLPLPLPAQTFSMHLIENIRVPEIQVELLRQFHMSPAQMRNSYLALRDRVILGELEGSLQHLFLYARKLNQMAHSIDIVARTKEGNARTLFRRRAAVLFRRKSRVLNFIIRHYGAEVQVSHDIDRPNRFYTVSHPRYALDGGLHLPINNVPALLRRHIDQLESMKSAAR